MSYVLALEKLHSSQTTNTKTKVVTEEEEEENNIKAPKELITKTIYLFYSDKGDG